MSQQHNFKNRNLQYLHNMLNTPLVANLKNTDDIRNVLYPYVRWVINDPEAYEESKHANIYRTISEHIETNQSVYVRMDLDTSMCFTLFMNTYH
jgi:hypothetical protein